MPFIEVLNGPEVGQKIVISQDVFFIGRDPNNHLPLTDRTVSRKHAVINLQEGKYTINDLKSLKGLLVNGVKKEEAVLEHGDEIAIGAVRLRFFGEGEKGSISLPRTRKKKSGLWLTPRGFTIFFLIVAGIAGGGAFFYFLKKGPQANDTVLKQHYERGLDLFNHTRDMAGAKKEWQKVLELDPQKETPYGQKAAKLLENIGE